jgi:hypothetical protein
MRLMFLFQHRGFEIMFHVAPLLPYYPNDPQQLERKRHLGNDVVLIMFLDSPTPIDLSVIKSKFNHVFCLVQKNYEKSTPELVQYKYVILFFLFFFSFLFLFLFLFLFIFTFQKKSLFFDFAQ